MGIASALLGIPLLTAALIALLPARNVRAIQAAGLAGALATLALSLGILQAFDPGDTGAAVRREAAVGAGDRRQLQRRRRRPVAADGCGR